MDLPSPINKPLFQYFIVFQLDDPQPPLKTSLQYIYPGLALKDKGLIQQIPEFCFPDYSTFPRKTLSSDETRVAFCLSGTTKTYGFATREIIRSKFEGSKLPLAFCFLTDHPFQNFFEQLALVLIKHYRANPTTTYMDDICLSIMSQKVPDPGESISVSKGMDTPPVPREVDVSSIFDSDCIDKLLLCLEPIELAIIHLAMLLERRVIFVSSRLSVLGGCVHAAVSTLLWPLSWQHVYVPILPPSKLDFVMAPMPFVVGILLADLDYVLGQTLDEVVFVHLDSNPAVEGTANDYEKLAPNIFYSLVACFQEAKNIVLDNEKADLAGLKNGIMWFSELILSKVPQFVSEQRDRFLSPEFVSNSDPQVQPFIKELVNSQLFNRYKNQFFKEPMDDRVREFVRWEATFQPQPCSYSHPEFYLKAGFLYKQIKANTWPKEPQYCLVNHTCLVIKIRPDMDPAFIVPWADVTKVELIEDTRLYAIVIKTKSEGASSSCVLGHENKSCIVQWQQIISYAVNHYIADSQLVIPTPKRKKKQVLVPGGKWRAPLVVIPKRKNSSSDLSASPRMDKAPKVEREGAFTPTKQRKNSMSNLIQSGRSKSRRVLDTLGGSDPESPSPPPPESPGRASLESPGRQIESPGRGLESPSGRMSGGSSSENADPGCSSSASEPIIIEALPRFPSLPTPHGQQPIITAVFDPLRRASVPSGPPPAIPSVPSPSHAPSQITQSGTPSPPSSPSPIVISSGSRSPLAGSPGTMFALPNLPTDPNNPSPGLKPIPMTDFSTSPRPTSPTRSQSVGFLGRDRSTSRDQASLGLGLATTPGPRDRAPSRDQSASPRGFPCRDISSLPTGTRERAVSKDQLSMTRDQLLTSTSRGQLSVSHGARDRTTTREQTSTSREQIPPVSHGTRERATLGSRATVEQATSASLPPSSSPTLPSPTLPSPPAPASPAPSPRNGTNPSNDLSGRPFGMRQRSQSEWTGSVNRPTFPPSRGTPPREERVNPFQRSVDQKQNQNETTAVPQTPVPTPNECDTVPPQPNDNLDFKQPFLPLPKEPNGT